MVIVVVLVFVPVPVVLLVVVVLVAVPLAVQVLPPSVEMKGGPKTPPVTSHRPSADMATWLQPLAPSKPEACQVKP
eukprot:Skav225374  [mRNA]  locus=scaffold329:246564:248211:- [translate_table: standard]